MIRSDHHNRITDSVVEVVVVVEDVPVISLHSKVAADAETQKASVLTLVLTVRTATRLLQAPNESLIKM